MMTSNGMKSTAISIIVAATLIGMAFMLATRGPEVASEDNVSVENGTQIVKITAKGRYTPTLTEASANMPTTLRIETNGTFDCTSNLRIPSIGYQQNLPPTGSTDIELPPQKSGSVVQGVCAMGMYNFTVRFN